MQRFKEVVVLAVVFFFGWQIGLFACTCGNPNAPEPGEDCCQVPHCKDYPEACPSGWFVYVRGQWHRCCRTYTGSHRLYGDPPCCEWSQKSQSYIAPGCRPFVCRPSPPSSPPTPGVWHCERKYATRYGNWEEGDYYICEPLGDYQNCGEKYGYCDRL